MERNVLEILECQGIQYANKIALEDKDGCLTYEEFRNSARRVASGMMGIGKRMPVIVLADRTMSSVVMFWSVVYSGNFYVPVDAAVPHERLRLLIASIRPAAILAEEKYIQKTDWEQIDIPVFAYGQLLEEEEKTEELEQTIEELMDVDPLYMVFTSGSTGVPKGVVKTHRSVLTFLKSFVDLFQFENHDVFGNQTEFDFDVSAKNIYTSIYVGGTLCLIPKICFILPVKLTEFLNQHRVTVLIWAASAVKYAINARCFQKEIPRYVKKVLFSGEALPAKILNSWKSCLPEAMYVNLYAPSEVTGNCLYHVIEELADDERIPLGRVFPNMEVMVLNENKEPIRENEIGEIYVRGAFLSSGYYENCEKTNQVYIQNPLHHKYLDLVYKTGDLAEKKNDKLYFVSRMDDQIKHMGHRIELGEIESLAMMVENVDSCSALFDETKEKIILVVGGSGIQGTTVLKVLRERLPKYMVPHQVLVKSDLPQNSHGKVDKEQIKTLYRKGEL